MIMIIFGTHRDFGGAHISSGKRCITPSDFFSINIPRCVVDSDNQTLTEIRAG